MTAQMRVMPALVALLGMAAVVSTVSSVFGRSRRWRPPVDALPRAEGATLRHADAIADSVRMDDDGGAQMLQPPADRAAAADVADRNGS
jgi:hypothetical protein